MAQSPFAASAPVDDEAAAFFTAGNTAAKFPTVGHEYTGDVIDWSMRDQTDADTGELLYRVGTKNVKASEAPNGGQGYQVAKQLCLDLQCEPTGLTWEGNRYNPVELPDDDGIRTAWVKGTLKFAFGQALAKAGKEMGLKMAPLEQGARVRIVRVKDGPKQPGAKGAPYRYQVEWTPAAKNAHAAASLLSESDPWAKDTAAGTPGEDKVPF